jgi:hypothetical protein
MVSYKFIYFNKKIEAEGFLITEAKTKSKCLEMAETLMGDSKDTILVNWYEI